MGWTNPYNSFFFFFSTYKGCHQHWTLYSGSTLCSCDQESSPCHHPQCTRLPSQLRKARPWKWQRRPREQQPFDLIKELILSTFNLKQVLGLLANAVYMLLLGWIVSSHKICISTWAIYRTRIFWFYRHIIHRNKTSKEREGFRLWSALTITRLHHKTNIYAQRNNLLG